VSIAPEFHENERLENNWNKVLLGEETVLFDPIEAVGTPKAPVIIGPIEGISSSLAPNSPVFDPQWNVPGELPDGETIIVDIGALGGSDSGDEHLEPPIVGPLGDV
jgi:hypothetical protein